MSKTYVAASLRKNVTELAKDRCEYCLLPASSAIYILQIDHIIPEKQGGTTELENLALSCRSCNLYKGDSIGKISLSDRSIVPLFHPRVDHWSDHFKIMDDGTMSAKSKIGEATIFVLKINGADRINERKTLINLGIMDVN